MRPQTTDRMEVPRTRSGRRHDDGRMHRPLVVLGGHGAVPDTADKPRRVQFGRALIVLGAGVALHANTRERPPLTWQRRGSDARQAATDSRYTRRRAR